MVALSIFGTELGPQRQCQIALLLLLVCIVLEIAGRPFQEETPAHSVLKRLELSSLLVEWITLWCGLMIYQSGPRSDFMNTFMTMFVILCNVLLTMWFVIVLVRAFVKEKKKRCFRGGKGGVEKGAGKDSDAFASNGKHMSRESSILHMMTDKFRRKFDAPEELKWDVNPGVGLSELRGVELVPSSYDGAKRTYEEGTSAL